jgi:hypothetical protein
MNVVDRLLLWCFGVSASCFVSCAGISLKTQFLYALVFLTRYLDLFWNFASMYNWVMKIIFIASSCAIVYMMAAKAPYKDTYQKDKDTFKLWYLIVPCAVLALIFNESVELGRGQTDKKNGTAPSPRMRVHCADCSRLCSDTFLLRFVRRYSLPLLPALMQSVLGI